MLDRILKIENWFIYCRIKESIQVECKYCEVYIDKYLSKEHYFYNIVGNVQNMKIWLYNAYKSKIHIVNPMGKHLKSSILQLVR